MDKLYTLEDAKRILLREKHTKVMAQKTMFGHINFLTWDNGKIQTATTLDKLPEDGWEIINLAGYIYDLFNEFRCQVGAKELVYEDFKGEEHVFRYGSEKEIPFNRIMQQRWYLRNTEQVTAIVGGGRRSGKTVAQKLSDVTQNKEDAFEAVRDTQKYTDTIGRPRTTGRFREGMGSEEAIESDQGIFKKGTFTGRVGSGAIASNPQFEREYLGKWGEELTENTSDGIIAGATHLQRDRIGEITPQLISEVFSTQPGYEDALDAMRYAVEGGYLDGKSQEAGLPSRSKKD